MEPYNKPKNKDLSFSDLTNNPRTEDLANQVDETRGAISSDIRELGGKLGSSQLKEEAKNAGKEFASGAQEVMIGKAIEVKDVVVDKAIEVKDAIVDKTVEASDIVVEKLQDAKQAVVETLDEAGETAGRWSAATLKFARANAVPLILMGFGATWLLGNSTRGPKRRSRLYTRDDMRVAKARLPEERGSWDLDDEDEPLMNDDDRAPPRGKARAARAVRTNGSSSSPSKSAGARMRDGISSMREESDELMQRGKQRARREAGAMRDRLVRAKDTSLDFADANPLAVALAAIAFGIGVGALLPTTEPEERLLRPTREKFERLIGDAREVASDVVETAKETVQESMA